MTGCGQCSKQNGQASCTQTHVRVSCDHWVCLGYNLPSLSYHGPRPLSAGCSTAREAPLGQQKVFPCKKFTRKEEKIVNRENGFPFQTGVFSFHSPIGHKPETFRSEEGLTCWATSNPTSLFLHKNNAFLSSNAARRPRAMAAFKS